MKESMRLDKAANRHMSFCVEKLSREKASLLAMSKDDADHLVRLSHKKKMASKELLEAQAEVKSLMVELKNLREQIRELSGADGLAAGAE